MPERPRPAAPPAPSAMTTAAALETLLAATERLVERSKAYHAAENLASAYGFYIDEFAWDETADIFSRNGWKELSFVGPDVGRERIRESLKRRYPNGKPQNILTVHQIVQPVIHVSADGQNSKFERGRFSSGVRRRAKARGSQLSTRTRRWRRTGPGSCRGWIWTTCGTPVARRLGARDDSPTPPSGADGERVPAGPPAQRAKCGAVPEVASMPLHDRNRVSNRAPALLGVRP